MNNIHMSSALVTIAHGEPEWWTGPEQTGHQLLESGAFAEQFVAEQTTADLVEIRRIVFQMLGMDHLVLFIDACCCYSQPDVSSFTQSETVIISEEERTEALNAAVALAKAAKKRTFNVSNIRRLLWFAIECGLDLGQTARHLTPYALYLRGIGSRDMNGFRLRGLEHECGAVNTTDVLTRIQLHGEYVDVVVTHAVLACTTFNAETVLHDAVRLDTCDSGSAVWFEILDMLFAYHQRASPAASSMSIMSKCLHLFVDGTAMMQILSADSCDKQRRMLPYLLRKPDLSDGSIILMFCGISPDTDVDHIIACAELCGDHPNWPHMCVKLIDRFTRYKQFVATVNRLPGVNVESQADIAAYVIATMKLGDTCQLGFRLMQVIAKYGTFDTVLKWVMSNEDPCVRELVACVFAHRLFLTWTVAERAVIYDRYIKAHPGPRCYSTIIYYLMHGEDAFGTYPHRCSLHLVFDMLVFEFEDCAIAHIIDASHAREHIQMSSDCVVGGILDLCKKELRFDLLMRLVNRHYRPGMVDDFTLQLMVMKLEIATCYSVEQRQILINHVLQPYPM